MSEKVDLLDGHDIPLRELTEEEANREITIERIRDFHYEIGEDFLDQHDTSDAKVFAGWLAHKFPELSLDIYDLMNRKGKSLEINSFRELIVPEYNEEEDINTIYFHFVEFANGTKHLKKRINQVLIQIAEHYNN